MADSTTSLTFLDPQPQPGDPDRVWFVIPSSGTGLYAVSRSSCSCPYGAHNHATITEKPCKHLKHLLGLLGETPEDSTNE